MSKHKHYALHQLRELREVFAKQAEEYKRDPRAIEKRKAQLRKQQAEESMQEWEDIKRGYEYRCAYCGEIAPLTMDHIIPLSRCHIHAAINIVPACRSCNASKGNR